MESTLAKAKCTLPMIFHLYHLVNCLHREAVATLPLCGKTRAQDKVRNWSAQGAAGSQEHRATVAGGRVFPGSVWNLGRQLGPSKWAPGLGSSPLYGPPSRARVLPLLTFPKSLRNPERPHQFLLSPTHFSDAPPTLRAL